MKCCSRSTLGVVIGVLNVIAYTFLVIASIIALVQVNEIRKSNPEQKDFVSQFTTIYIIVIVLCLIMIIISSLLITGIVKRRHKLMLPWIILSGIGFVINCGNVIFNVIFAIAHGLTVGSIIVVIIVGVLGIGLSALILWLIFSLYRDIRRENNEKPGRIMNPSQVQYQPSTNYFTT